FISDVTDKILPQIEDWQNRPLDEVYPILYIDAIHYSVRDNGVIRKLAAYVILGINTEGKKEVLTISVGDNESAKYWLSVMNELKNRGVKDVLIICADGLTGIKEAIAAAFPKTEYQRCNGLTLLRQTGRQLVQGLVLLVVQDQPDPLADLVPAEEGFLSRGRGPRRNHDGNP
ncbi:transposase, Mutator family, partial [human gut metagenome]